MRMAAGLMLIMSSMLMPGVCLAASSDDFLYANTEPDGSGLPYRYFVPPGYDPGTAYPLILFLHGAGERGSDNQKQLNNQANGAMHLLDDANLALQPVFMIAPQCPAGGWWSGSTLATAVSIIDTLEAQYNIDPDRIYITGLSMGGMGTWSAVTAQPGRFAAAVPMSGNGNTSLAPAVKHLPFWFFHAANDPTVGVGGSDNLVGELRDAGARVIYTRYDTGGHGIWPKAYVSPMLFKWMMAQRRGQRDESVPPSVHIEQPSAGPRLFTRAAAIDMAGLANNGGESIDAVEWSIKGGASGNASGTTSWSAAGIALREGDNLIRVLAAGPSYTSAYGGLTSFNDSLLATRSDDLVFVGGFDDF